MLCICFSVSAHYELITDIDSRLLSSSVFVVHKAHREELDGSIWLLGKVIYLLPELVSKRWQCHSTSRILMKLLHHGNSTKLRREGVRYFLIWFQALGDSEHGAPEEAHAMFNDLVPGLTIPQRGKQGPQLSPTQEFSTRDFHDLSNHPNFRSGADMGQSVFHDQPQKAPDISPLILPASNERTVAPDPRDGLEILLESMVQSTGCLKWTDNNIQRHLRGFHFLLQRFREVYLPVFCPSFDHSTSIFEPKLDLPVLRNVSKREELMSSCVVVLINWIAKYTNERHVLNKMEQHHIFDDVPEQASLVSNLRHIGYTQAQIVRDVMYSSRDTVNFVHEVYRQAFLLNFTSKSQIDAMKVTIGMYRDWMSTSTPPPFLFEPDESSSTGSSLDSSASGSVKPQRLRTDSYIGAITKENTSIRAGMQNMLQIFVTNALHVFMVSTSHLNVYLASKSKEDATTPLDEQTEICKRVLNIYRTMVMKTRMESKTWEQLLMVLLQITSVILAQAPPNAKRNNLGGRLAQPIFQTLIVTWIRAHTNVVVHPLMWEKFLKVLSSLTHREELIVEWDKTMQTLTRVLARQVYNLNLQDLPLDRLADQKGKRRRVGIPSSVNVWQNSHQCSTDNQQTTPTANASNKREENSLEQPRATHPQLRHIPGTPMLNRSYSEGSLATPYRKSRARRRTKVHQVQELPANVEHTLTRMTSNLSAQMSISMETLNMSKLSGGEPASARRALSLDSIRQKNDDSESYHGSRSPSPTASSGLDGNSMKDSPLQMDVLAGGDSSSIETHDENLDRKSILAGGTAKGWLPDVAAVMWRRMLGALGDVNKILNPKLHAEVFRYLVNITDSLIKIRMNQGISNDNLSTPSPPTLVPPIGIVLPWCYGALTLESQYNQGKIYAMQLLCMIARNFCLSGDQLPLFYHALHQALTGENRQMAATALKYLGGPRFLSLLMPGHSMLYLDLIHACTVMLTSMDVKGPRAEAAGLLGSLLCFPKTSLPGPVLQPAEPHIDLMECPDLQEHVLNIVLRCARREPTAKARSIAISSLGQWVLQNLTNPGEYDPKAAKKTRNHSTSSQYTQPNMRITEAFQVILQALQFRHRVIARIACETLRLCSEKGAELARVEKLPALIVEALCYSLEIQNIPNPKDSDKNVLTSLLLCLGELCMSLPMGILYQTVTEGDQPILLLVFKVLHRIATGNYGDRIRMYTIDDDFDMTIAVDDVREQSSTEPSYQTQETIQQCQASIQLCAKTVAMHLVTNISHFPLGIGATRLSSMVDEHDDLHTGGHRESLRESSVDMYALQVIPAQNLQLLMLSSELVATFIELPALKLPCGLAGGLVTANKQVRLLLRDLNGKSCWDASIIYCEPKMQVEHDVVSDEVDFDCSSTAKSFQKFSYGGKNQVGISLDPMISTIGINMSQPPRHTLRHRQPHQLPIARDMAPDLDQLDDLLQYIGFSSPECLDVNVHSLNTAGPSPLGSNLEAQTIAILLNQRAMESDYVSRKNMQSELNNAPDIFNNSSIEFASIGDDITIRSSNNSAKSEARLDMSLSSRTKVDPPIFHFGRLLFSQIGLAGWERRKRTNLLNRTDKLLRELRNLDAQKCRETHKMAVIYVASGQEDKNSILR